MNSDNYKKNETIKLEYRLINQGVDYKMIASISEASKNRIKTLGIIYNELKSPSTDVQKYSGLEKYAMELGADKAIIDALRNDENSQEILKKYIKMK
ncbi:MAG: hypothetical protein PHN56_03295 [Candidatus Nanoarchaeia archaeon]|nr:hypothetical protein [Candidatus Nanoarchaeia archaeon]